MLKAPGTELCQNACGVVNEQKNILLSSVFSRVLNEWIQSVYIIYTLNYHISIYHIHIYIYIYMYMIYWYMIIQSVYDIYALNSFIEHSGEHWWEQNIFLFVHHTTSILAKLSTWCFEHSGDIGCSLLVNPSHTDESWEVQNLDKESITANQLIESLERNMLRKTWQLL